MLIDMIIFHANGKRLQLAHENEEFFIFQTNSTFVKNAVSYLKEEKMYFGTLLTLWLSTHLIGDFFA